VGNYRDIHPAAPCSRQRTTNAFSASRTKPTLTAGYSRIIFGRRSPRAPRRAAGGARSTTPASAHPGNALFPWRQSSAVAGGRNPKDLYKVGSKNGTAGRSRITSTVEYRPAAGRQSGGALDALHQNLPHLHSSTWPRFKPESLLDQRRSSSTSADAAGERHARSALFDAPAQHSLDLGFCSSTGSAASPLVLGDSTRPTSHKAITDAIKRCRQHRPVKDRPPAEPQPHWFWNPGPSRSTSCLERLKSGYVPSLQAQRHAAVQPRRPRRWRSETPGHRQPVTTAYL